MCPLQVSGGRMQWRLHIRGKICKYDYVINPDIHRSFFLKFKIFLCWISFPSYKMSIKNEEKSKVRVARYWTVGKRTYCDNLILCVLSNKTFNWNSNIGFTIYCKNLFVHTPHLIWLSFLSTRWPFCWTSIIHSLVLGFNLVEITWWLVAMQIRNENPFLIELHLDIITNFLKVG